MNRAVSLVVACLLLFVGRANAVEAVEATFEETFPLDVDGAISIRNVDGSIRIYAADVSEVHVRALKRAYSTERLNGIEVVAQATAKSLTIDTRFPPRAPGVFADKSGVVDYTLIVPTRAKIETCELSAGEILIEGLMEGSARAHLVNGWLAVHNCFVETDASIANGKLDIAFDWWPSGHKFAAKAASVNGGIRALVPPDASLSISARSDSGHVANTVSGDDDEVKHDAASAELSVGNGDDARVELHAANGNVRIDRSY